MKKTLVLFLVLSFLSFALAEAQVPATRNDINQLRNDIDQLRKDVTELITNVSNLGVKVDKMDKRLSVRIEEMDKKLSSRIDSLQLILWFLSGIVIALIALPQVVSIFRERSEGRINREIENLKREMELPKSGKT